MATITTGVVLLRWQLLSAVLMFLASTLNIRFRKSDYIGWPSLAAVWGWFCLLVCDWIARHNPGGYVRYLEEH